MTLLDDIRKIESTPKELRQFATVMAVAFGLIGGIVLWRGGTVHTILFIIAAVFAVPALIDRVAGTKLCTVLLPLQKVWMTIAVVIGFFVSRMILGLLFYTVFTSIGTISRLVGKPLLDRSWGKETESYWIIREERPRDPKHCEKQF